MKKNYPVFTTFFALFAFLSNLYAQEDGEWLWAKAYSGHGNQYHDALRSNSIVKSAFDEAGNVYILGTYMIGAKIDGEDILSIPTGDQINPGQVIAKFDIAGNLVWKKVIKFANSCRPKWIQVRGNKVYVFADVEMAGNGSNTVALYYLDTLVRYVDVMDIPLEQCTPPFGVYGRMNVFITFDLDGNVLRQHFLQYDDRVPNPQIPTGVPWRHELATDLYYPFYVDRNENIYMLGKLEINGSDPSAPLYTVIDGARKDAFYMPDTVPDGAVWGLYRWVLYKFTPNFDLLWVKPFIHRTEGIPPLPLDNDSINARYFNIDFLGISGDEEDNLYISGNIRTALSTAHALLCTYPIRYYFDNSHYGIIYSPCTATTYMPFLIKYDMNGNVLWNQQLHYKTNSNTSGVLTVLQGSVLDESSVYVTYDAQDFYATDTVFIDAAMTIPILRPYPDQYYQGLFVRYYKGTGNYQSHGIVPAEPQGSNVGRPAAINNHVLVQSAYSALYVEGKRGIDYFRDDGEHKGRDLISCAPTNKATISEIIVHPLGILFTHFTGAASATFGDITVNTYMSDNAAAFFAMMHKPSLLIPYAYNTHHISGQVTLAGNPLEGVTINYGSSSVVTNAQGLYSIEVEANNTVTLMPSLTGYTFTPGYITCDNVTADLFNQDFVATADTVGIVSTTLNNQLRIYPNPTTGELTITYPPLAGAGGGIISDVEIFDIYGKKLQSHHLIISSSHHLINISHLPSGIYFLKVSTETGIVTKKITKI